MVFGAIVAGVGDAQFSSDGCVVHACSADKFAVVIRVITVPPGIFLRLGAVSPKHHTCCMCKTRAGRRLTLTLMVRMCTSIFTYYFV